MSSPQTPRFASSLVTACTSHICDLSKLSSKHGEVGYRTSLCHEFGRFRLWTHGFDKAPPPHGNILDEVLEEAKYLKEPTVLLLASFASCLLDNCLRKVGNNHTRKLLHLSLREVISVYPHLEETLRCVWDTQDKAIQELRACIDALFDMVPTLDNVVDEMQEGTDLPEEEPGACPILGTGSHWEIYQRYIRDRFPQAIEGLNIEGFAKGNAQFYELLVRGNEEPGADEGVLQAEGEEKGDYEEEGQEQEEQGQGQQGQQEEEEEEELAYEDCELEASQHLPIIPEEPAINDGTAQTILGPTKGSASRDVPATFKDSGLGSSAPGSRPIKSICPLPVPPSLLTSPKSLLTDTLLAPPPSVSAFSASTICSTTSEPRNRRLLPRVPDHSRGSPGFNCTFCGCMQLPTTQGHAWRKHVFADLAPYMCIRSRCPSAGTFYTSKKAWVAHDTRCIRDAREGAGESTTEMCPFCLKDFGRDTGRFYSHAAHHMEDIRLFALPPAFREYEVGVYKDSSGVGSSEHTGSSERTESPRGRSPIAVHVAKNKVVDPLKTREWAILAQVESEAPEARPTAPPEPEDDMMGRTYRRTLGGATPAGTKGLSTHRERMGWDERVRSTAAHAPPTRSRSSSEESSVDG